MGRASGPGPRTLDVLAWLARVGVSPVEPISRALGLSKRTTYDHLARLRTAGWVELRSGVKHQSGLIAVTPDGLERAGWPRDRAPRLSPFLWEHHVAEAEAAAWLSTHPRCRWWSHEREFSDQWSLQLRSRRRYATHRPDLVAELLGDLVAIEVELSVKTRARLRQIIRAYAEAITAERFAAAIYLVRDDAVARVVNQIRDDQCRAIPRVGRQIQLMHFARLPQRRAGDRDR